MPVEGIPQKEFGSASSIHQYFLEWKGGCILSVYGAKGLAEYDEMEGIAWSWQSIDGSMVKPFGTEAVERIQPDRGKNGTKRSLLVDGNGIPLSLVVSGTEHDVAITGVDLRPNW